MDDYYGHPVIRFRQLMEESSASQGSDFVLHRSIHTPIHIPRTYSPPYSPSFSQLRPRRTPDGRSSVGSRNSSTRSERFSQDFEEALLHVMTPQPLIPQMPAIYSKILSEKKGIESLHEWQRTILSIDELFSLDSPRNLVYSTPTSAGKSLVAETLLLHRLLNTNAEATNSTQDVIALYVLPFISLVEEKAEWIRVLGSVFGFAVDIYAGPKGVFPVPRWGRRKCVILATMEKANAVLNNLFSTERGESVVAIVMDEIHIVGDTHRGHALESLVAKVLMKKSSTQLIAMSATVPNLIDLGRWMNAVVFEEAFRPIPLQEYVYCGYSRKEEEEEKEDHSKRDPKRRKLIADKSGSKKSKDLQEWMDLFCTVGEWYKNVGSGENENEKKEEDKEKCKEHTSRVARTPADDGINVDRLIGQMITSPSFMSHDQMKKVNGVEQGGEECKEDGIVRCGASSDCDHSVMVFCTTKRQCHWTASELCKHVPMLPWTADRMDLAEKLIHGGASSGSVGGGKTDDDDVCVDDDEKKFIRLAIGRGIMIHHSGLTMEERALVEDAYRNRVIRVLCCTSTLAVGVNLPARMVIFRGLELGAERLDRRRYMQMAGRAGRAGCDPFGEAYIIPCRAQEASSDYLRKLFVQPQPPVISALDEKTMVRLGLECVAGGLVSSKSDISRLCESTLQWAMRLSPLSQSSNGTTESGDHFVEMWEHIFEKLLKDGLIEIDKTHDDEDDEDDDDDDDDRHKEELDDIRTKWKATAFGLAACRCSMSLDDLTFMHGELKNALNGLVLSCDIHLCYLATPLLSMIEPRWNIYAKLFTSSERDVQRTGEIIGISDEFLTAMSRYSKNILGKTTDGVCDHGSIVMKARRFYSAMMLNDVIHEMPLARVARKYFCDRGALQQLMSAASSFSMQVAWFCGEIGWGNLACILISHAKRVQNGVGHDLVELMRIRGIGAQRARMLFKCGYQSASDIANARIDDLAVHLNMRNGVDLARSIIESARELVLAQSEDIQAQVEAWG